MHGERTILHVDMDAFYASIEQRDDPALRGRPVVVGGGENRGVVAAASYEVRRFGVRSAMPMAEAQRRCPDLVRVRPRMKHYQAVSRQIFAIFHDFTPVVEGLSLDEAFLDVTASAKLFGDGERIGRAIKARILEQTALTASVGVAANKLVAKIASDLDKPDGLVVITPAEHERRLDPLPATVIPGIGPETSKRLDALGIVTIGDLRRAPARDLEAVFGRYAARTRERAAGIDGRPVMAKRREKSISAEETFDTDLDSAAEIERELLRLAERTAGRLRRAAVAAGTLVVKIREPDFTTVTRQRRLSPPSDATERLYALARDIVQDWRSETGGARIRLLGVGATALVPAGQRDLFDDAPRESAAPSDRAIDRAMDDIRQRFGDASVSRARTLGPHRRER